jgi:hypothetical protein
VPGALFAVIVIAFVVVGVVVVRRTQRGAVVARLRSPRASRSSSRKRA